MREARGPQVTWSYYLMNQDKVIKAHLPSSLYFIGSVHFMNGDGQQPLNDISLGLSLATGSWGGGIRNADVLLLPKGKQTNTSYWG